MRMGPRTGLPGASDGWAKKVDAIKKAEMESLGRWG